MFLQSSKRQSDKMVKQTQTIRRQNPANRLSVFDQFACLALEGVTLTQTLLQTYNLIGVLKNNF